MRESAIQETRDQPHQNRTPARSWEAFEQALAAALATLDDEYVIVSAKEGNRFVQFGAQPSHGLRAEVVSNAYLQGDDRLVNEQLAALSALGWSPPTGAPEEATPEKQPRGSPNFFRDFPRPVPCEEVARLTVRTLADVLRIVDPSHLEYRAFDAAGHPLYLPELHLAEAPPPPPKKAAPASPTFESFRHEVRDDARSESESLLRHVYGISARLPLGYLVLANGGLYGCVDVLVPPFVAKHLLRALAALDAMAARFAYDAIRLRAAGRARESRRQR